MSRGAARIGFALAALAWAGGVRADVSGPMCFSAADDARLSFAVFQQAPPPHGAARAYPHFPLTAAATMQIGALNAVSQGVAPWWFQWANRSNAPLRNPQGQIVPRKPNRQPAAQGLRTQRTAFTSIARADACTFAQAAALLGRAAQGQAAATRAGIRLVAEHAQADVGAQGPDDACLIPAATLPAGVRGIVLDYEVADGRTPAQTLAFLTQWLALVHDAGRQAFLLANPFDAPTQVYTGLTPANANAVARAFDYTAIWLWGRNAQHDLAKSYAVQRRILGDVDPHRLVAMFDLGNTTLDDARFVRHAIVTDHLAGVMFQRDNAAQGGGCAADVNRKTAIVAFGADAAAAAPMRGL